MPRPRLPVGANKDKFLSYRSIADSYGEKRDCSVIAVAAATGAPYASVLAMFTKNGRKPGCGVTPEVMTKSLWDLGFRFEYLPLTSFNPPARAARGKHGITSHHPDRFPQMWQGRGNLICWNRTHMWAVVDGVTVDWSRGKSLRVNCIVKVVMI